MAEANSIPKRMSNRKRPLPSLEDMLKESDRIYSYNVVDGNLYWKGLTNPNRKGWPVIGSIVGGDDGHGYRMCLLLGHKFKVHQIVWLINKREFPQLPIDHIDGDRRNNRIENLRLATDIQNMQNTKKVKHPLGGVQKSRRGPNYTAKIIHHGETIWLGSFPSIELARDAYVEASRNLRGEFSPV